MRSLRYRFWFRLWHIWHIDIRRWWGWPHEYIEGRPWYQLCCNGNAGGWRTAVCDYMEIKWRNIERDEEIANEQDRERC